MARAPRITIPALPHHIIQRGNNRQGIFFDDDDYRFYLQCLRQAKDKRLGSLLDHTLLARTAYLRRTLREGAVDALRIQVAPGGRP
ncbi:MAG: hypothetical protein ACE5JD_17150 [Candidatus Methylomirabilia bacterium]